MEKIRSTNNEEDLPKSPEQVRNVTVYLGDIFLENQTAYVDDNGYVQFANDLFKDELHTLAEPDSIDPLIKAGVVEANPIPNHQALTAPDISYYQCAKDDHPGEIHIRKEDINRAIREDRLKADLDGDDVEIE